MQSLLADTAPHRARFAWLSAALAASIVVFALSRPVAAPRVRTLQRIGHCHEFRGHAVAPPQAASVHSYYVYY
jgi:hypothetical protein